MKDPNPFSVHNSRPCPQSWPRPNGVFQRTPAFPRKRPRHPAKKSDSCMERGPTSRTRSEKSSRPPAGPQLRKPSTNLRRSLPLPPGPVPEQSSAHPSGSPSRVPEPLLILPPQPNCGPGTWEHDGAICHARLPATVPASTLTLTCGVGLESARVLMSRDPVCWLAATQRGSQGSWSRWNNPPRQQGQVPLSCSPRKPLTACV